MALKPHQYRELYTIFSTPISTTLNCGAKCAPLNKGVPVCCDHTQAVPSCSKPEWTFLQAQSELWREWKPKPDKNDRKIAKEIKEAGDVAIVCKGAAFCERDNRSLVCRTYPFVPYVGLDNHIEYMTVSPDHMTKCWVISNLSVVSQEYIDQFFAAFAYLFANDENYRHEYVSTSDHIRKEVTKRKVALPLIRRDGATFVLKAPKFKPEPTKFADMPRFGVYESEETYQRAVKNGYEVS